MTKTLKVTPASGIGDGLMMMIVAEQARAHGFDVTLPPHPVEELFPTFDFTGKDSAIHIIQNDNSKRCWDLLRNRPSGVRFFFPRPCKAATAEDFMFSQRKTMVQNIVQATEELLGAKVNASNGLYQNSPHTGGKVFIHPTSMNPKKNWRAKSFIALAEMIQQDFDVTFCVSPKEFPAWEWIKTLGFDLPQFSSLVDLKEGMCEASYLIGNDSALGHLASNLGIPTLSIGSKPSHMRLWRPGWAKNVVVTPRLPLPNFKGVKLGLRDKYWADMISPERVYKGFMRLCKKSPFVVAMG